MAKQGGRWQDPAAGPATGPAQDVAAGDRAETSGIPTPQQTRSRPPQPPPALRAEARGAAPALAGMARPGFVRQAAAQARLQAAGQPLARRRRIRDRIGQRVAGSGFVHALVLVLLALMVAPPRDGGNPPQQAPVEMMYERPGSAGMVGAGSPEAGAGSPTAKPLPDLRPPAPTPPAEPPPVPEAVPLPEAAVPEPLPKPSPEPPRDVPTRRQADRSSPLSNPMNLSFSQAPTPQRSRRARAGGSGAAIDLSLGPMVQGGHLLTPYASATSIKGVSDDYADEIGAWIRRHMYYPEEAARRGEDGPSHVHVVLDRQGRVSGIRLVNSSGSFLLDDATQGMFRNAKLPPVPPDMSGNSFDVDLTIDYILIRH